MAGAMAGSAVLNLSSRSDELRVVTLTVNNGCNLRCPHCYLQYEAPDSFIEQWIIDALFEAEFSHLAIVGKEPLVNRDLARRCQELALKCVSQGKTVSIITNGHGLCYLHSEIFESLAWIDVSLDGGPKTYTSYRLASYKRLKRNLQLLEKYGYQQVNAMFTLNEQNLGSLDDMMEAEWTFPFQRLIFSPYVMTLNHGHNPVSPISFEALCCALTESSAFMESAKAVLLFGTHVFPEIDIAIIKNRLESAGLLSKTILVEDDPLNLGILRVTYDGLVLTPYESLHTINYKSIGRPFTNGRQLNKLYNDLHSTAYA